ncbi:hypothetical protein [Yinghuangia seranimata]|uniref:hypothetical protein n=1 Tax=Yinghuangia seranimata TaxID=408067 RepID=UPI00248B66CD|nr:hypothetical protein [Yinghuangia seranimata]MDI2128124.1 hypothetical protein [Yinghuangia seranimata]
MTSPATTSRPSPPTAHIRERSALALSFAADTDAPRFSAGPASSYAHGPLLAIIARRRRYARSVATTRVTAALRRVA